VGCVWRLLPCLCYYECAGDRHSPCVSCVTCLAVQHMSHHTLLLHTTICGMGTHTTSNTVPFVLFGVPTVHVRPVVAGAVGEGTSVAELASAAGSPGLLVALLGDGGTAQLWDVRSGTCLRTWATEGEAMVGSVMVAGCQTPMRCAGIG
jgi:hypothetical protein